MYAAQSPCLLSPSRHSERRAIEKSIPPSNNASAHPAKDSRAEDVNEARRQACGVTNRQTICKTNRKANYKVSLQTKKFRPSCNILKGAAVLWLKEEQTIDFKPNAYGGNGHLCIEQFIGRGAFFQRGDLRGG